MKQSHFRRLCDLCITSSLIIGFCVSYKVTGYLHPIEQVALAIVLIAHIAALIRVAYPPR